MKQAHIITYGCQMNEHDSEQIAGMLTSIGYTMTPTLEQADVILLNTCSIREKAQHKLYSQLGKLKLLKTRNPDLIIGVCGCVAQQEGDEIFKRMPYVDLVLGTNAIPSLPALLERLDVRPRAMNLSEIDWDNESGNIFRECRFKAYITIMRGCDNFCSYCVVPYTRGREKSRPAREIIEEARHLVNDGTLEITLLGQNVSSYVDPAHEIASFSQLLEAVNAIDGLDRLRFVTAHPKDLSDELIDTMARLPKVCEHIHLPIQSGSDSILERMNRRYTRAWYMSRIRRLREAIPNIAISTDIIVGFPGERDEDFQQTLSILQDVQYDGIFVFAYSNRPNAKASELPDQISEKIKDIRLQEALELERQIYDRKNAALHGKILEVLPEKINPRFPDTLTGRTRMNHLVTFPGRAELVGKFVQVEITEAHGFRLSGRLKEA